MARICVMSLATTFLATMLESTGYLSSPNGVSKVANGRYEGIDLATLYAEHRELFGNRPEPVFPLLTKILDANDWLSVQVHPDDRLWIRA